MNPKASLNYDSSRKNWLYYLSSHCLAQSEKAVIFGLFITNCSVQAVGGLGVAKVYGLILFCVNFPNEPTQQCYNCMCKLKQGLRKIRLSVSSSESREHF